MVDSEVLSDCDLQAGPCIVELAGQGRIRLEIGPRPFVPLTPLVVKAEIRGLVPESVALDLVGIDMYMGYNRPRLEPAGDGRYVGQLVIPVCSSRAMNWQARLLVRTGQGLVAAPFHFRTDAS